MRGLSPLLEALPRWTLVGGKGGVGKTTCAGALASTSARRGERTLLLSTDPARSLADALGVELTPEPAPVPGRSGLDAMQLDAETARDAFLGRWRDTLITIVDRGTYLDLEDIAGLIDAALPGADEAMALLTLADLEHAASWRRIIVDTAPTGHTLRLLALPDTFRALVALLDSMQGKHRFVVASLTHRYRSDEADAFIAEMRGRLDRLAAVLRDPNGARLLLVARAEGVVAAETLRYLAALDSLGLAPGGLVINALDDRADSERDEALAVLVSAARERSLDITVVPVLEEPPMGLAALDGWGSAARPLDHADLGAAAPSERAQRDPGESGRSAKVRRARPDRPVGAPPGQSESALRVRPLTIVGGKGGVGKTTVACALAVVSANEDAPVLVVSTDPAPSVADALLWPVGDEETAVAGAPGLDARQMDASAAFERVRTNYAERIDAVFDSIAGGAMDATYDRRILRDLLALAPPGIDELYALASLGETLGTARYASVVVDPAPTGHLLRLLEMPLVAVDWSHRLMRLLIKYREIVSLGEAAEELLAFARRTRALQELLVSDRAGLLVVALDEPLVRAETARLVEAARERGVDMMGVFWNRVSRGAVPRPLRLPLSREGPGRQFVGERVDPPPRGVEALRDWSAGWRAIPNGHG